MDDRLQSIITSSKNAIINVVINTYDYLDNILVFKEYEINPDDDLITQTKMFILRYRRIIGILLLIILLYMGFNCNFGRGKGKGENADSNENRKENVQKGGDFSFSGSEELTKARIANEQFANDVTKKYQEKKKKDEIEAKLKKADDNKAAKDKADSDKKSADAAEQKKKDDKAAYKKLSFLEKKKLDYSGKGSLSSKGKEAFARTSAGRKIQEMKDMRASGKSKFAVAGNMAYQAGAYVGDKAKEFAGWLYEILFAIAISIAICMVVLPSISFFIVGIICFFLLKSKISTFKSL
jgi:hypothetical protein